MAFADSEPLSPEFAMAEMTPGSVIAFDRAGKVQFWNPGAELLFGWSAFTMKGSDVGGLASKADDEARAWSQLLQEGVWEGRIHRHRPDGAIAVAEGRRHVRYDASGEPRDIIEFAWPISGQGTPPVGGVAMLDGMMAASWKIDVTPALPILEHIARLGDASEDEDQEETYLALVRAARIVEVNERTARLVGGNRGRAVMAGQSVAAFWPIPSRMKLAKLIVSAVGGEAGRKWRAQLPNVGILRDPVATVWRASDDRPEHLFIMVNGIADDDRSYPFIRASEARYRKLIDHIPDALWQVDASHMAKIYAELREAGVVDFEAYLNDHPELVEIGGTAVPVTDVNRRAVDLIRGAGVQDLIRPVDYLFRESPGSLQRVMVGRFSGAKNHSELMKIRTFDNQILDVRMSVTYPEPVLELDVTILSIEDVTEQVRIEAQLRQLQADFSHAARISTLGELTSSFTHEINQPLAAIMTNAETSLRWLARAEPDIEKVRQLTTRITANAQRADDILQRIRRMAVKHPPQPVPLPLNEVVEESLLFVRHEIETRNIRVVTSYGRRLPSIVGDRIQLQQVVVNLLLNAVQAIESLGDGEIVVSTEIDVVGALVLSLRDNGPGIPPENLDRIFDGFFTTKEQGMGIGLAICQSIVAAHGGALSVANRPEGGAEFRVVLPRSDVQKQAAGDDAPAVINACVS